MALVTSGRENKQQVVRWRSKERVVRGGVLVYAIGTPIPREEAVRQGLIEAEEESTTKDTKGTKGERKPARRSRRKTAADRGT